MRVAAELTVRQTVGLSGCPQGTLSGWFAGQHVRTDGNEKTFRAVLAVCGIDTRAEQEPWLTAVRRARGTTGRRRRDDESPYRGLEPFRFDDAGWFFGRAELTADLVGKVDVLLRARGRPRILFVIGASGSGKSSLSSAGLLSALQEEGLTAGVALPGSHPLDALRELEETEVVVLDQFEETWTQCEDEVQRAAFLDAIADHERTRTGFVLGLRADFYRHAAEESVLHDALAANAVLVRPLSSDGVREVIVEPARKAGWTVVQLLLLELAPHGSRAAHDAGALPILHCRVEFAAHWSLAELGDAARRSRLVGAIVGGGLTSRLRYSLTQVGHAVPTWPQLGTAATMAGAVGDLAARLIACGGGLRSGRYRVDLGELLLGVSAMSTSS